MISWVFCTESRKGKSFCSAPHFQPASPMSSISAPKVMMMRPSTVGSLAGRRKQISMSMPNTRAKAMVMIKASQNGRLYTVRIW
jgi:hypothetical protein